MYIAAAGWPLAVSGSIRTPVWTGEGWPLSSELAARLFVLRIRASEALRDGSEALARLLRQDYGLGERAARALASYFQRQECLREIPERATCLVEAVVRDGAHELYIHTPLNRLANDALARVAVWRLAQQRGWTVTSAEVRSTAAEQSVMSGSPFSALRYTPAGAGEVRTSRNHSGVGSPAGRSSDSHC